MYAIALLVISLIANSQQADLEYRISSNSELADETTNIKKTTVKIKLYLPHDEAYEPSVLAEIRESVQKKFPDHCVPESSTTTPTLKTSTPNPTTPAPTTSESTQVNLTFKASNNFTYYILDELLSKKSSEEECEMRNGSLAVGAVNNITIMMEITAFMLQMGYEINNYIYVGFQSYFDESEGIAGFVDNQQRLLVETCGGTPWKKKGPSIGNEHEDEKVCLSVKGIKNPYLTDMLCSREFEGLCETSRSSVSDGFDAIDMFNASNGLAYFKTIAGDYSTVRGICQTQKAELAVRAVNDYKVLQSIFEFFGQDKLKQLFVGFMRESGDFFAGDVPLLPPVGGIPWDSNQPDNPNSSAKCVAMRVAPNPKLHDVSCLSELLVLCEIKPETEKADTVEFP